MPETRWVCDLEDETRPGVLCGAVFASHRALAMHRRRAHNFGFFIFSSRAAAIHHLIRAYEHGYCPRHRSLHTHIIRTEGKDHELQCRICHEWCTHPAQLLSHTRTHRLPLPRPKIKLFRCTKHASILTHARRRVITKRHDHIWMAAQSRLVRALWKGRRKKATHGRGAGRCRQDGSEGRPREGERQVQRERKGKERVIGRTQRPHLVGNRQADTTVGAATQSVGGQPADYIPGSHGLSGHQHHARSGSEVPQRGTSSRLGLTRATGPSARGRVRSHDRLSHYKDHTDHAPASVYRPFETDLNIVEFGHALSSNGSGYGGAIVTNSSAQPDPCTNSSEQRNTRRSHQSGTVHSGSAPHVRDGPARTPRETLSKHLSGQETQT